MSIVAEFSEEMDDRSKAIYSGVPGLENALRQGMDAGERSLGAKNWTVMKGKYL